MGRRPRGGRGSELGVGRGGVGGGVRRVVGQGGEGGPRGRPRGGFYGIEDHVLILKYSIYVHNTIQYSLET